MGKRIVHECDLTKQEFDPAEEEYFVLTIKKKGKRAGMTYDLTSIAAERLLAQLNAGSNAQLSEDWCFANGATATRPPADFTPVAEPGQPQPATDPNDAAAKFVREKRREREELGFDDTERDQVEPLPVQQSVAGINPLTEAQSRCSHMNKGRPKFTMVPGSGPNGLVRYAFHTCRQCKAELPIKPREEQSAYLSAKPSDGSRSERHSN